MFDWGKYCTFALGIWVIGVRCGVMAVTRKSEERRVKNAGHVFQSKATSGNW